MEQIKQAFSFEGTATRSQYWAVMIGVFVVTLISLIIFLPALDTAGDPSLLASLLFLGSMIAAVWVQAAIAVRRLRDCGLNTWWVLTLFIPQVNIIPLIVFGSLQTQKAE